ncbi:MAG: fibronectin type III domain-containing protein [Desulfopila sp.]
MNLTCARPMTLALLGASLLASGCGYKNSPVPPQSVVPRAIEDLRYTVQGDSVQLSWTYPDKNVRGQDIGEVSEFSLYRAEVPLDDYCPTCPIPFVEPIAVPGGQTVVDDKRRLATYDYNELRQDHKYFFKVRTSRDWWASSADSNIVTFVWHTPAAAPTGLAVSAADSAVTLSWQPVTRRSDGEPIDGELLYRVLRKSGEGAYAPLGAPQAGTSLVDRQVVNSQSYRYQVQSLLRFGDDLVVGGVSDGVTVTPVDTTPPNPPDGVLVIGTSQGPRVVWEPSTSDDVAGYNIYRRTAKGRFALIGSVTAPDASYIDTSGGEDAYFIYAVTAFDRTIPANESRRSAEAAPRF